MDKEKLRKSIRKIQDGLDELKIELDIDF